MFYLLLVILAEVAGTTCAKLSEGFSRLLPSVLIFVFYGLIVFYGLSLGSLGLALKRVDLSFARWRRAPATRPQIQATRSRDLTPKPLTPDAACSTVHKCLLR